MKLIALFTLILSFSLRAQTNSLPYLSISGSGFKSYLVNVHVGLKAQNTSDDRCLNVFDYGGIEYRNPHDFHLDAYSWVDFENTYTLDIDVEGRLEAEIIRQRDQGTLFEIDTMSVEDYLDLCRPAIFQLSVIHRDSQLQLRDTPNASYYSYYLIKFGSTRVGDYSFSRAPESIDLNVNFFE